MMVWWNVWIYCNLNLCVAVVELGPKSSTVQTSHRFNYIQGGTLLQRFSIFGKNIQLSTYRSFSVYLGQPVSAINLNGSSISGAWTLKVESCPWNRKQLVTGYCDIVQQSAMAETSPRCSACWPTAVLQDESGRGLTNPSHNQQWDIHFHSLKTVAWTIL